jgi:ADP-heptose:LPS heptosyltransferase
LTDRARSIRLELLRPILGAVGDAEFFSFQVGAGREQLEMFRDRVADLTPYLHNFADTAAALQRMDRVISVDTAVAHLAGSLGLDVWLLLSYTPCWRWLLDTSRSPWYPSVKLVRQRSFGDWEPVVAALKKELYNIKL